ncbi:mannitol dehydrogenase family protein [Ileibacterium valens]|uniref:mannitol dehydrogenase family protein n=1 Tax=Ileibacterium valens TaxID=1862668 RepID=UPI0035139F1F
MMKLSNEGLKNTQEWVSAGFNIPTYDRHAMVEKTIAEPTWVHFGAGNLFKAFPAAVAEKLLNEGKMEKGVIAVEGFDPFMIEVNKEHDNLAVLATLKHDGNVDKTVVGSIAETVMLDPKDQDAWKRMASIFTAPSLQMASFTITEKGYAITDAAGNLLPLVEKDFENGPQNPESYLGKVASLLYERYKNGQLPIAMVSMDNCSHNGQKLQDAIVAYAKGWVKNGKSDEGFVEYLENPAKVSFPWSMIDKITPRPDASVEAMLEEAGLEDVKPVKTPRGSFVAPFVNAEETEYLVIEDAFPNGKVPLDLGGIIYTDRDTVNNVEKMKVTTCLNPLHTAMSIYGCLLDYDKISEEMKDEDIVDLIRIIGYDEGLPVVVNPGILDPKQFIDTVIGVRLPNPFMPDAPQRIATDTSQKLSVRFGETIKSYLNDENLSTNDLKLIPVVFAGWIRYLMGIDDQGEGFEISADPLLEEVRPVVANIKLGDIVTEETLRPILSNQKIFGVDLYEAGMADEVVEIFNELIEKPGAVRKTLHKKVTEAKEAKK